jgi:hypothetical protein
MYTLSQALTFSNSGSAPAVAIAEQNYMYSCLHVSSPLASSVRGVFPSRHKLQSIGSWLNASYLLLTINILRGWSGGPG